MRAYLVIIDESEEAGVALRFASRRAAKTGGTVHVLALVAPQPFLAFGSIQATIEAEAFARAEHMASAAVGDVLAKDGHTPVISVRHGEGVKIVREYIAQHPEVAALVLGAAREGHPGPLVSHFSGQGLGGLGCPLYIIPGTFTDADLDRLS